MSSQTLDVEHPSQPYEAPAEPAVNPRKRKKSSRACDFCHVNHQPCDNSKPTCGYCEKHHKPCTYLRPQKKRGPAQGYRSALHTMRESAAAWGAALHMIPSLGPVIEEYLRQSGEGRRLSRAIKDPQQQEFFIRAWQQSNVFKALFEKDAVPDDAADEENNASTMVAVPPLTDAVAAASLSSQGSPVGTNGDPRNLQHHVPTPSPSSHDGGKRPPPKDVANAGSEKSPSSLSLDDIVARDAARSSSSFSRTLVPLGFGPDDYDDFLSMSFNPEPTEEPPPSGDMDPDLGSEMDQKAFYELLMGKRVG